MWQGKGRVKRGCWEEARARVGAAEPLRTMSSECTRHQVGHGAVAARVTNTGSQKEPTPWRRSQLRMRNRKYGEKRSSAITRGSVAAAERGEARLGSEGASASAAARGLGPARPNEAPGAEPCAWSDAAAEDLEPAPLLLARSRAMSEILPSLERAQKFSFSFFKLLASASGPGC